MARVKCFPGFPICSSSPDVLENVEQAGRKKLFATGRGGSRQEQASPQTGSAIWDVSSRFQSQFSYLDPKIM